MRQERTVQASIFDFFADHEIGRELKAMSQWLDEHRELIWLAAEDLRRHGVRETGREGLPAESVLRSKGSTSPVRHGAGERPLLARSGRCRPRPWSAKGARQIQGADQRHDTPDTGVRSATVDQRAEAIHRGMARLLRLLPNSASPHEPRSVDLSKIAFVSLAAFMDGLALGVESRIVAPIAIDPTLAAILPLAT